MIFEFLLVTLSVPFVLEGPFVWVPNTVSAAFSPSYI